MTADERQRIRLLIDQARRADPTTQPNCRDCGCPYTTTTTGCLACQRRFRRRAHFQRAIGDTVGFTHKGQTRLVMTLLKEAGVV